MKKYIIIALLSIAASANAQEFNTNERISDQLKRGSAPGLQFAPVSVKTKPTVTKKENHDEPIGMQIKKRTAVDMKFKTGGSAAPAVAARAAAKSGPLPSEVDKPAVQPKPVTPVVVPSQQ